MLTKTTTYGSVIAEHHECASTKSAELFVIFKQVPLRLPP